MVKKPVFFYSKLDGAISSYMRINKKTTQSMADLLQMSESAFCNKRTGKRNFSAPELLQLCHILGVSVDEVCMPDFLEQVEKQEAAKGKDGAAIAAS